MQQAHPKLFPWWPAGLILFLLGSLVLGVTIAPAATSDPTPHLAPTAMTDLAHLPRLHRLVVPTPLPPPILVEATPPIDFAAIQAQLQSQGQDLAFVKMGFHVGVGGNATGLGDWMAQLDAAGAPFFLKSVDTAGPIYEAQLLQQASGVPHTLVYRRSGPEYDVPDYTLSPQDAAEEHWQRHLDVFPPELDPSLVWLETINEVDKHRAEWLADFALATAHLALADGYRWAAFGWSTGEPEPEHWESPAMLDFLRLVADHPDQLAITLHEYSLTASDIGAQYPYLIGRFQHLLQICDEHDIPRPPILITEWGWEYETVPPVSEAMTDIAWASWLYAAYPEVQGAALWYLGGGFGGIADQAQQLIAPLRDYSLSHYYIIEQGQGLVDPGLFQP